MKFSGNYLLRALFVLLMFFGGSGHSMADTGYELWLNYKRVADPDLRQHYAQFCTTIYIPECTYKQVLQNEFDRSLGIMLGQQPVYKRSDKGAGVVFELESGWDTAQKGCTNQEGYRIQCVRHKGRNTIFVRSESAAGLLYGMFHLLRMMQCGERLDGIDTAEAPKITLRMLNHWDDLNGDIERGYAGGSLWNWEELPETISQRYIDYARANASIGINSIVLNNVNADPRILRHDYLVKIAALADVFRAYHIRVFLSVNFAAPMPPSATPNKMKNWGGVGDLPDADPLNPDVIAWWNRKVKEIYDLIPDFGGFLVKANSEGMPGPQNYNRTHADGANMLARALKPYNGIVLWRTFVYNAAADPDRLKRPFKEFFPLDGAFEENVILQAKNGPLDFQPREPVQPLYGAMKKSIVMPELQITQEYTGQSTYLVYLLPMWKEFFSFDTYCQGPGSTIAKMITQSPAPALSTIAGVANTGSDENWTGHHFAQANWYAFGKLAWNPDADSDQITDQWIRMTWNCGDRVRQVIHRMMEPTWESFVSAVSPYSLGFTCGTDHYRAGFSKRANKLWLIDTTGIGVDRSIRGSDYVSQYISPNRESFDDLNRCPEKYLLCFHFVPWTHRMRSGKTLASELREQLHKGSEQAEQNLRLWRSLDGAIDRQRYREVEEKLLQEKSDAKTYYQEAVTFFQHYLP